MDLKEIKRIIDMVESANISALSIENEGLKIEIKKELYAPAHQVVHLPQAPMQYQAPVAAVAEKPAVEKRDENTVAITSPMVGTFYLTPNPESPAYVKVGEHVNVNHVVCIIEAMKIFNEIESEVSGVVERICVENGTPVEYGQELFIIRKA